MGEQTTKDPIRSVEELLSKFNEDSSSTLTGNPTELSPDQKLTRFMSIILLALVFTLIILSVILWDGSKDGKYVDLWEYSKLIGTTIIGGVVATYLHPSGNN